MPERREGRGRRIGLELGGRGLAVVLAAGMLVLPAEEKKKESKAEPARPAAKAEAPAKPAAAAPGRVEPVRPGAMAPGRMEPARPGAVAPGRMEPARPGAMAPGRMEPVRPGAPAARKPGPACCPEAGAFLSARWSAPGTAARSIAAPAAWCAKCAPPAAP